MVGGFRTLDLERIINTFKNRHQVKMGDFITSFEGDLNRDKVKYLVERLTGSILNREGSGKGTIYMLMSNIKGMEEIKTVLRDD